MTQGVLISNFCVSCHKDQIVNRKPLNLICMKKSLLLIVCFLVSLTSFGQASVYHPFPTNYGTWNYQYYDDFGLETQTFTLYVMDGDTSIAGQNYKKIYQNTVYMGGLREASKVIYFYPDAAVAEVSLYDFNLHVGDRIIHPYGGAVCTGDTATVISEDSIPTANGYRRQLTFDSFARWIEGVGSMNYFLQPCNILCVSGNDFIKCAYGDTSILYSENAGLCVTTVEENILSVSVLAYPNPSTGRISFNLNNYSGDEFIVSVFDANGKEILRKTECRSKELTLNDNIFSKGLYIYKIQFENSVKSGKFIIN